MSIDEAINGFEKLASNYEFNLNMHKNHVMNLSVNDIERMQEYLEENRQLAEWLKELKHRRSYENGCQYCKYKFRSDEDEPCIICSHNYTDKFKDDGTREVNADVS